MHQNVELRIILEVTSIKILILFFKKELCFSTKKQPQKCVSKISPEAKAAAEASATFSLSPLLIHTDIATLKKAVALCLTNKRDAREKGDKEYFHSSRKYREISWDDDDEKFMYYIRLHM